MSNRHNPARNSRNERRGGRPQVASTSCRYINAMIIKSFEKNDFKQVLAVVAGHLPQMNLVNLTTALHRLAKLTASSSHSQAHLKREFVFEQLLQSVSLSLDTLEPTEVEAQSLSNVAWSLATLKLARADLFSRVVALATSRLSTFQHFELCTFLWACAKLGAVDSNIAHCTEPIFAAAAIHIVANAGTFSFRCWANLLWAFATAKQFCSSLFSCAIVHMLPQAHVANCQELANTTWALGKVSFLHGAFFNELANHALVLLWEFKPQEISNMIWGFGCVGFFHEEFFAGAAATLQGMELSTQHLANILTAVVRAAPEHPVTRATILNLLPQCCVELRAFKPQEVSAALLAVAKAFGNGSGHSPLGVPPHVVYHFFEVAAPLVLSRLPDFSAQSLASLAGAFARLQVCGTQDLMDAVSNEASKRRFGGNSRADFQDSLHVLSLAECAVPAAESRDSEQSAYGSEVSFAPSQALKKNSNAKRRRGRALAKLGGSSQACSEAGDLDVSDALGITESAEQYLQWHKSSGSQMSSRRTLQESVYNSIPGSVDAGIDGMAMAWPCLEASRTWQVPISPQLLEQVLTHPEASERVARSRRALSPLVEGIYQVPNPRWNCSVKNSFLHVGTIDSMNDQGNCRGGSSHRSSSVPSRLDYAEPAQEWHQRSMNTNQEMMYGQRYTNDMANLNFTWGSPGLLGPGALRVVDLTIASAALVCAPLVAVDPVIFV